MSDPAPLEVWDFGPPCAGGAARRVLRFAELPSTNDLAQTLPEGGAVVADFQTRGRGQYGRAWVAPPGSSLMMSVRLELPPESRGPALVTALVAVAVADAIREVSGLSPALKWPNDLLVGGRKVCGILVELGPHVVAGLGLNLSQSRAEFDAAGLPLATSILASSGRPVAAKEAARAVLGRLDDWRGSLRGGDLGPLESAWAARLGLVGRVCEAELAGGRAVVGAVAGLALGGVTLDAASGPVTLAPEGIRALRPLGWPGDSYTG